MKVRYILYLLAVTIVGASCQKNNMSKIPQITLKSFGPPSVEVNKDTAFLVFSLQDGDADLGHDPRSGTYDIFIKDFRYDTGYAGYFFPEISDEVKDPNKGLKGTCTFMFAPFVLTPRLDSIHIATGDTTHFEVYIMDLAGNTSNHIITNSVIMTVP